MAKGSTVVPVRFPDTLLAVMDQVINEINETRKDEPYDRSSFIRYAIAFKINHVYRSRKNGPFKMPKPIKCEGE